MDPQMWGVILPAALTAGALLFGHLVSRRKNTGDERIQFIAVLQAERATADARADKAEARADTSDRRARRFETLSWRYHQQLLKAGLEPDPTYPTTDESERVTA